jgi:hypothetical protein
METHVSVLRRVGIAILVFFAIHTFGLAADFATGASHSFTIDVLSLILGILLVNGSLGAARWVAFLTGFQLVGMAVALFIVLPAVAFLFRAELAALPFASSFDVELGVGFAWAVAEVALEVAFAVWVVRELRDPIVEEALAKADRGSIRRATRWGGGFAVGLFALLGLALIPLSTFWKNGSARAVAAAQRQYGSDWEYTVVRMNSNQDGWSAHLVAKRGDETKEVDVGGSE